MIKLVIAITTLLFSNIANACNSQFVINLQTLGQNVTVELRNGVPGSSKIIEVKRSSGGRVDFKNLCPGSYFLAIGDNESVNVTPVRQFRNGASYESNITVQRGSGNVSTKKRNSL